MALLSMGLLLGGAPSLATPLDEESELLTEAVEEAAADLTTPEESAPADEGADQPGDEAPEAPDAGEAPAQPEAPEPPETAEVPEAPEGTEAPEAAEEAAPEGTETEEDGGDLALEAPAAEEEAADDVSPLFVPPGDPPEGQAKLIARAGGDRTGTGPTSSSATALAGVTFEFFRATGGSPLTSVSVGTCTTDETGECGLFAEVPGSFGGLDVFYVEQVGAPSGWTFAEEWAPGSPFAFSGSVPLDGTAEERTLVLPAAFNSTVTEPTIASVRNNNEAPPQCGLDMAMVLDLSNSVTETEELLDEHKAAANDFITSITGTPSQVALYTFGSAAPAAGPTNGGLPLTSVATPESAQQIIDRINGYQRTPSGGGGTNWDRAFHQVAESGVEYDVVLFLTDGQPTFHRDRQGPGDVSTIAEVNEAILSANAVKATGAQVVLVGIGPEAFLPGASIRIPLVSGPEEDEDFFRTNLANLSATLQEIANADCAGTITVVKEVVDTDGDIVPGGAGWTFSTATEGVTPTTATTDDTSAVNFEVGYTSTVQSRSVTVTETPQEGYQLVPVDGENAQCVVTATGEELPVTNSGPLGFTVDVAIQDIVSCTVRNAPDYEDLVVEKTATPSFTRDWDWDITKVAEEDRLEVPAGQDGTFTYDVTVTPEGPTDSDFTVSGTIEVSNPNDVDVTGVTVLDTLPGGECSVDDGTELIVPGGQSVTVSYSCELPGGTPTTTGTNTATVTWDAAAFPGTDGVATDTEPFDFASPSAVVETDRYVTVTDSEYDLSDYPGGNAFDAVDGEAVLTYDIEWPSTPGQCVEFENTATIVNSPEPLFAPFVVNESATEVVTLCAGLDLEVEKNVVVSFDRTYLWEIDKEADETTVTVDPDTGTATVGYTVTATPTGSSDANWAMQGAVTVSNPNEWLDITADVTDTVDVGGGAVCTVDGGEDVLVAAGATVELDYTCTFVTQPSYSGTNTATATWADTVPTPSSSASGTADIEPGDWSQTPINETIDVVDDQTDPDNPVELGEATWNADGTPVVFTYTLTHEGVPGTCVEFTNTAWIDQTQQEAEETVTVCEQAPPVVDKTADASLDRQYLWLVEKSVDQTSVTVDEETGEAVFGYVVTATPDGVSDSGWELDGTVTVENPNDFGPITVTVTDAVDVGGGAVCAVEDGEDVVIAASGTVTLDYSCTFTGEPAGEGTNTATVTWTDSAGAAQSTTATADVEFAVDEEVDETVDVIDDQTDPANPVTLGTAMWTADGTPVEFEYDLTHTGVPGECVEFTNTAWVEVTGDDPEDSTTAELCVSTLEHTKTAVGADQQADGTWLVRYEIDVVNSSTFTDVYSLSDTIEFSEGVTPLGALWFPQGDPAGGGTWTDPVAENPTTVLATDVEIAAGTTDTYVVLVTADVAENVIGTEAGLCDEEELSEGGGFLNAATLTVLGEDETVRACAEPVAPTVAKTAGELVAGEDGTWDVSYTIDVTNQDADQTVSYDLSDEFDFVEGVDILDASIERDGTVYEDWDGVTETEVVTGVLLPPATTHTYTVTVTVSLADVVASDDSGLRECGEDGSSAGQGLFNLATITSGNDEYDDEACVPVPDPDMSVDKTAVSADQLPDGTWEVVYEVVASNDSSVGGVYDLTDTLEYSEGITPLSAEWVLEGTAVAGEWDDLPDGTTATLAEDRPLAGGDSHTYVVTVTAAVAAGVVGGEAGQCSGDDGTEGGGFLNAATLTAHGEETTDRDCAEPVAPTVDKTAGELVAGEDGTWDVTYTIDVANPDEDQAVVYDLSDELGFAEGVEILDATIERDGTVYEDWDGDTQTEVVTGVTLPPATTHTYTVTVTVDLIEVGEGEVRECDEDGSTAGRGLFNGVVITSGEDEYDDDACVPILEPQMSVDKTVVSADGLPDGDWQVTYEVVVTNDSALGGLYDLTDTLEFGEGITPLTAEWVLEGTDVAGEWTDLPDDVTTVLADDRPLAAGASHTYVVTVVSDVATGVVGTEAGRCTGEEGTDGGGFLNAATVTAYGEESTARDCVPPTHERPEKTFDSAVELDDGTWEVSYTLVVDNSHSPWDKYYRLDDIPRFAEGVTIVGQEAWDVTDPEDPRDLEWDGEGPLVEQAFIGAGEVQRYEVSFVVEIAAGIPDENLVCGPEGPGHGFFNRVALTTGNDTLVSEDCGPITPPRTPGLPPTGVAVAGAALLAVLLSVGGLALRTTRRRKEA